MRKHFIDNLRWIVILLLIPYHAAQSFNTWGELNYICFSPNKILSSFIVFLSPYYMPLMFLLAGMSTKYALKKRSYKQFLLERIKRLLIPFVFGTLAFCPLLAYMGDKNNFGWTGSFFAHYKIFFTKYTDFSGLDGGFGVGQFWFLLFLFLISLVGSALAKLATLIFKNKQKEFCFPLIFLFSIPLPFLYDFLSVGGKSFSEYLYIFLLGFYILSDDTIIEKAAKYRYVTLAIGLSAGILNCFMFIWSQKDFGSANIIAKALCEWFMLLSLIGIGKKSLDFKGKVSTFISQRAFLIFSFHFVWIVLFQFWLSSLLGENIILLYLLPIVLSYIATFICAEVSIRFPVLCFLLGTKIKGEER